MRTVVVVPPDPVVTWEEADAHLRLDGDDTQQPYVESLIAAATAHVDGPNGILGRAVGEQTLELRMCGFPRASLILPYGPVGEVESVKYLDADGAEQTAETSLYEQTGDVLRLAYNQTWPSPRGDAESVRIRYTAGWATEDVPAPIKAAILLMVGHWYRNRQAVATDQSVTETPMGVDALLAPYRVLRV